MSAASASRASASRASRGGGAAARGVPQIGTKAVVRAKKRLIVDSKGAIPTDLPQPQLMLQSQLSPNLNPNHFQSQPQPHPPSPPFPQPSPFQNFTETQPFIFCPSLRIVYPLTNPIPHRPWPEPSTPLTQTAMSSSLASPVQWPKSQITPLPEDIDDDNDDDNEGVEEEDQK